MPVMAEMSTLESIWLSYAARVAFIRVIRGPCQTDENILNLKWSDVATLQTNVRFCSRLNRSTQHFIVEGKDRERRTIGQ